MVKTIIIFFGPPGSGKGTQADRLAEKTGWRNIAVGELLRQEQLKGTKLGRQAAKYMAVGKLFTDGLIKDLVAKHLKRKPIPAGIIFDGYPRQASQHQDLLALLKNWSGKNDRVYALEIAISDREVKQRLTARRSCSCGAVYHLKYNPPKVKNFCDLCGQKLFIRVDDRPAVIDRRLKLYHQQIKPLLNYYQKQKRLIKINGQQPIKKVHQEINKKLKMLKLLK